MQSVGAVCVKAGKYVLEVVDKIGNLASRYARNTIDYAKDAVKNTYDFFKNKSYSKINAATKVTSNIKEMDAGEIMETVDNAQLLDRDYSTSVNNACEINKKSFNEYLEEHKNSEPNISFSNANIEYKPNPYEENGKEKNEEEWDSFLKKEMDCLYSLGKWTLMLANPTLLAGYATYKGLGAIASIKNKNSKMFATIINKSKDNIHIYNQNKDYSKISNYAKTNKGVFAENFTEYREDNLEMKENNIVEQPRYNTVDKNNNVENNIVKSYKMDNTMQIYFTKGAKEGTFNKYYCVNGVAGRPEVNTKEQMDAFFVDTVKIEKDKSKDYSLEKNNEELSL
ncbi:hypothetical protein [Clostridium perfringens]|uniref:hypothetical protein n=1 Tax=Clostridium perfringens TaxID=1502 RepID=UPI0013E3987D|nr:hypothetical protein [Clostridium perfringens]NGT04354.1 hypothetical protein [Clostridium perfringens]